MSLKEQWVSALYSGSYIQTTHSMYYQGCMCSLGVLCDIADPKVWDTPSEEFYDRFHQIRQEAGLSQEDTTALIALNDHHQFSFNQIADYMVQCDKRRITLREGLDDLAPMLIVA